MTARIGIIGIGEAAAAIASGLRDEHGLAVCGYDVRIDDDAVADRARRAGFHVMPSLAELVDASDLVVCLTSAKVAMAVARDAAPHLRQGQIYTDWNSASPQLMRDVAEVITATGASFVDGAVMAAVPPQQHRVPVLLSGDGAQRMSAMLDGLGMDLEVLGSEPGQASAVKMFRSLLIKGLEALLLECAVGADAYGATRRVFDSMAGSLPTDDWNELAAYLLTRTVMHGERRAEELRQVAETLTDAGIEPLMADAGARRLQWLVDIGVVGDPALVAAPYDDVLSSIRAVRS